MLFFNHPVLRLGGKPDPAAKMVRWWGHTFHAVVSGDFYGNLTNNLIVDSIKREARGERNPGERNPGETTRQTAINPRELVKVTQWVHLSRATG